MPKITHRRHRSQEQRFDTTSSMELSTPRKVSFEEGHQSSSSFTDSHPFRSRASSVSSSNSCGSIAACGSRSSLRRKPPSVCLVDLANQGADEQDRASSPVPAEAAAAAQHCASPTDCTADINMESGCSCPSSPWGHFVDILIPQDEAEERDNRHRKRSLEDEDDAFSSYHNGFFASIAPDWGQEDQQPQQQQPSLAFQRKSRRLSPSDHPYGGMLPPRRRNRRLHHSNSTIPNTDFIKPSSSSSSSSFLPGFFLESSPAPLPLKNESSETAEVEVALKRLKVNE